MRRGSWLSRRRILRWFLAVTLIATWVLQLRGRVSLHRSFLLTVGLVAVIGAALHSKDKRVFARRLVDSRAQLAALVVVCLLGALARTASFDHFPPPSGNLWEESQTGKVAHDSIVDGSLDPYFPLTNLLGEVGLRLFGTSMPALRMPFVVLSVASVPAFFVATRLLCGSVLVALLTTALFATSAFATLAGRVALETMAPLFTLCVALAATFHAASRRSRSALALAGLANGLLATEYIGYKLIPPLAAGFLILSLRRPRRDGFCNDLAAPDPSGRFDWSGLALFVACLAAVTVPLLLDEPRATLDLFFEGIRRQSVGIADETAGLTLTGQALSALSRVRATASYVFVRGDGNDLLPASTGIVDPWTGVLGAAALLYCLARARACPAKLFLVASVAAVAVLSGVLVGNPARYRLAALVPSYLLAVGVGLDDLYRAAGARRRWVAAGGVAVVVGLCAVNLQALRRAMNDRGVRLEFHDLDLLLAEEAARLQRSDPEVDVVLLSDRDHLGRRNDYEFLYDPKRVFVYTTGAAAGGHHGFVVAYGDFLPELRRVPGIRGCERQRLGVREMVFLTCRVDGEGEPVSR